MPFPFSLLCLLALGMLNIDTEKLTIVCLYSYLHFYFIVESFFLQVDYRSLVLLSVYANKALNWNTLHCSGIK